MSVHVSSWAWQQEIGDDGAKLVLLKLADSANDHGIAFPGKDRVLVECEVGHEDTLRRRLRKLRDLELAIPVAWFGRDGRQTYSTYFLPSQGVPSAERLWQLIEQAPRKGSPVLSREELLAAEAVGVFMRSGGATVHPLDLTGGDAYAPPRGAAMHPPIEEPFVGTSEEELRSSLPADAGETVATRLELMNALGAALGVDMSKMPRRERRQWELAADDLVEVGASIDDVRARVAAWPWPHAKPGPLGIVGHWSRLGAEAATAAAGGFDGWLEKSASQLGREIAHDVVDDMPNVGDDERGRRHAAVDELYDRIANDERRDVA